LNRLLGLLLFVVASTLISYRLSVPSVTYAATIFDDFDDGTTDTSKWMINVTGDHPPSIAEEEGHLAITLAAEAAADPSAGFVGAGYISACPLVGDFDIQVDYNLINWPEKNGVRVALSLDSNQETPREYNAVRASLGNNDVGAPPHEVYLYDAPQFVGGIAETAHMSGTLRMVRSNTILTDYYLGGASWIPIHQREATAADLYFGLSVWSHDNAFADTEVKLAFDNMVVNQGTIICPVETDTPTPSATPTATATATATPTGTSTATATPTPTTTSTTTPVPTRSPTRVAYLPSLHNEPTPTPTSTPTETPTQVNTPTKTPHPSPTHTPTATRRAAAVEVLDNDSGYVSSTGSIWVVGEVQNNTSSPIELVKVAVDLFDRNGQLVASETGYTDLNAIRPGDKTCFSVLFFDPPENAIGYEIGGGTYYSDAEIFSGLSIINDNDTFNSGSERYRIVGQVKNESSVRARFVSAVATVYGTNGKVIRCDSSYVNSTDLSSGQTSSFEIDFYGLSRSQIGNYRLQADGRK
jgi:hypothetical protein